MTIPLHGARVLITGAAGALGGRAAERFAAAGARLALCDRDTDALALALDRLRGVGAGAEAFAADLLDDEALEGLVHRVEAAFGGIDVLVSCAGVEFNKRFDRAGVDELDRQLGLHLRSPMLLIRHALPGMLARGRGHVVVVSSLNGKLPFPGKVPYAAAKAGSIAMVHALRRDLAETPVGFSVVLPALVSGEGQAARALRDSGVAPPRFAGSVTPDRCADAVVDAVLRRRAEVNVSARPPQLLAALQWSLPTLADRVLERIGLLGFWRRVAAERDRSTTVDEASTPITPVRDEAPRS